MAIIKLARISALDSGYKIDDEYCDNHKSDKMHQTAVDQSLDNKQVHTVGCTRLEST